MRKLLVALLSLCILGGGGYWAYKSYGGHTKPTGERIELVAHTSGCSGASCNGKNPSGLCDDGATVGAMAVYGGILELRYSRSCKANWGRYTTYRRETSAIYPRMTVWNPGRASYGLAHLSWTHSSSWTNMTDGTKKACVGIEVVVVHQNGEDYKIDDRFPDGGTFDGSGESDSQGWTWGPCR